MRRILAAAMILSLSSQSRLSAGEMHHIDISKQCNQRLDATFGRIGAGNNLARLPKGDQTFNDVTFRIGDGMLQLGGKLLPKFPDRIDSIAVDRTCGRIHLLHSTCYGGHGKSAVASDAIVQDDTQIGEYIIHYDDGATSSIALIYGRDVRDWWYVAGDSETPRLGKVAWEGENDFSDSTIAGVRVYSSIWENPYPGKKIKTIDFVGRKNLTAAAPFCIAITLEDQNGASTSDSKPANN
jgi:hypothetical protein